MNSVICVAEDTLIDELSVAREMVVAGNGYITEPLPAIKKPEYRQPDQEELHIAFEEAISDRILALQSRLNRLSDLTLAIQHGSLHK